MHKRPRRRPRQFTDRFERAIGLSRQAASIIKRNLAISMAVIVLLIVATLGGWAGIGTAVLLHEGSTMVVVVNSLRLLTYSQSQ